MTNCELCHKQTLKGQALNESGNHIVCWLEWNERVKSGKCDRCGTNMAADGLDCSDCYNNDSHYSGYEGPQS